MSDTVDPAKRSWIMSRIRGKDTKIEVALRRYLFKAGFRYRKNDRRYPGTPDVVLPRFRTVIFVNGCFWHGHEGCKKCRIPKTRTDYWTQKIERNRRNDKANISKLEALGWNVIVVWECEVESDFEGTMVSVVERLHQNLRARQEAPAAKEAGSYREVSGSNHAAGVARPDRTGGVEPPARAGEVERSARGAGMAPPARAGGMERLARKTGIEPPAREALGADHAAKALEAAEAEPSYNPKAP